jgi:hypothetical protein
MIFNGNSDFGGICLAIVFKLKSNFAQIHPQIKKRTGYYVGAYDLRTNT